MKTARDTMTDTTQARRRPAILAWPLAPLLWLERARGRRRLALASIYLLILATFALLGWRESRLAGLPDVGDPFDVATLRRLTVPEDRNAFVIYERASAAARRSTTVERRLFSVPYAWPTVNDAEGLAYMADNAEAFDLWMRGTERPDALYPEIEDLTLDVKLNLLTDHRHFTRMALVHASRFEERGDMAGAWEVYRAILRGSRHCSRNGTMIGRLVGAAEYAVAQNRIRPWAADPRVDASLLRRALDDLRKVNADTGPDSGPLRFEYLWSMNMLNDPARLRTWLLVEPGAESVLDRTAWHRHWPPYQQAEWFLQNEPERSRRLFELAFVNWLAYCDKPPRDRPPMIGTKETPKMVYDAPTPGAPLPSELVRRIAATPLLAGLLPSVGGYMTCCDRERAQRAGLVIALAEHLYRREHDGQAPESPDALVQVGGIGFAVTP